MVPAGSHTTPAADDARTAREVDAHAARIEEAERWEQEAVDRAAVSARTERLAAAELAAERTVETTREATTAAQVAAAAAAAL
jgi:hypothetical protein